MNIEFQSSFKPEKCIIKNQIQHETNHCFFKSFFSNIHSEVYFFA